MKEKLLKKLLVVMLILNLTMVNFVFVGASMVSYAEDALTQSSSTNNKNIEFTSYFKDDDGTRVYSKDALMNAEDLKLYMEISVKNEGYFNGKIEVKESNFKVKPVKLSDSINSIEGNTINLNQINAGDKVEIEVGIEIQKSDYIDLNLLSMESKINLTGIYKDSKQKDIEINSEKIVKLTLTSPYSKENNGIQLEQEIITNKICQINGVNKKVVQVLITSGLKDGGYPISETNIYLTVPSIGDFSAESVDIQARNTLATNGKTSEGFNQDNWEYSEEDKKVSIKIVNTADSENKIAWNKDGKDQIIATYIYDEKAELSQTKFEVESKIKLYDIYNTVLSAKAGRTVNNDEIFNSATVEVINTEDSIYKGKIYSNIDRDINTKTKVQVNYVGTEAINLEEKQSYYINGENEYAANVIYKEIKINKSNFDYILGNQGSVVLTDENGKEITTINSSTEANEEGYIAINCGSNGTKSITAKIVGAVKVGELIFEETKTIKSTSDVEIKNMTALKYKTKVDNSEVEKTIELKESVTEARLEVNRNTLSTVVANDVEMKAILKGNNEQYDLYSNPSITFELPEEVENIELNSEPNLIYETELKIKNYEINKNIITIYLEGKQTSYKDLSIEGAILTVNANLTLDKKAATKTGKITMTCNNTDTTCADSEEIKIVAPKDVTTINSIKELNVETIGQEEVKQVNLQRGTDAKQLETEIEVINNNENAIEDVKIMGTFPTKNNENNIDIKIAEGIALEGIEGAKVYYTENDEATEDLQDTANGWKEEITDSSKVRKYLIEIPSMEKQSSIKGTYKIEIPALLEYNQTAKQGYSVKYTNTLTKSESEMKATTLELQTGVGPKLESKITQMIGGVEVAENSTVKNGEVIKYKIEVSNVGSEDLENVLIQGDVPEGTTLVKPQDNYEYTGASYYKELSNKSYEAKITKIKVGEVLTGEYEVRVNSGVEAGTKLLNTVQVKYGDVIKKSNESQLVTANGDIRVSVKRVTDRSIDLYESGTVQYFAIIENISNTKQDNVIVKTNLPNTLGVEKLTLITGMESREVSDDELYRPNDGSETETREIQESELIASNGESSVKTEEMEYKDEVNIGSLEAGEVKVLSYDMTINKIDDSNKINFSVTAKNGNDEYKSNSMTEEIRKVEVSLNMAANTQSQYVKAGDTIEYTITIKNNGSDKIEGLIVKDTIPNSLTVNKVSFDEEEIVNLKEINDIEISCNIAAQSESIIKIETIVNYSAGRTEAEAITNVAYAEMLGEKIATTSEVNHIIEANKTDDSDDSANEDDDNNVDDNDIANGGRIITGVAWFDENANGQKDDNEKTLENIKVHLLNTQTNNLVKDENGNVLEATTNDNGVYVLNNIGNGKYIVIFEYNKTQYSLTKYKADDIEESKNSDTMTNELLIGNEKQQVASTDILEINNENISGINMGLIELKNFNFRLDKYISKILIQDSVGTTIKEYDDATVAKAELDGKKINGTTVIIEYKIKVTNIGEIDGYVKKIADYMPKDLKFSSELNKDWYQTGSNLYNISLTNEKIAVGESREVKLTLTKEMTENNTGLINNTAEIVESYNELGIADSGSTPGNKVKGESDYGSADAILSLKTGGEVYIAIAVIVIAVLGVTAFIIIRKKSINGDKK